MDRRVRLVPVLDDGTRAALDRVLAWTAQAEGCGMDLGLKGKVAMVAGASRGLGFAVARGLAAEGASVSISSRQASAIEDAAKRISAETGRPALAHRGGRATGRRTRHGWHRRDAVDEFGGVDLLFVNAGGPPAGTALSFDDAAWTNAFELLRAERGAAWSGWPCRR